MLTEKEMNDNNRILNTTFSIYTKTMLKIIELGNLGTVTKEDYLKSPDTANSLAVVLQNKIRWSE